MAHSVVNCVIRENPPALPVKRVVNKICQLHICTGDYVIKGMHAINCAALFYLGGLLGLFAN